MTRSLFAILAAGCLSVPALAQPAITWFTIDGGGAMNLTAGTLTLSGTIGQPDATNAPLTNGTLSLTGGFWQSSLFAACLCSADFDGSGGTPDAGDIDAFFTAWLSGDATADTDCSGGTPDAGDIDSFFSQWLAGGC